MKYSTATEHPLRPEVMAEIKRELCRLEHSKNPRVLGFVERMYSNYPELKIWGIDE